MTIEHDLRARLARLPGIDEAAVAACRAREAVLTKPAGALGRLEEISAWLCGWQQRHPPRLERVRIAVFAGWHGIASRGVSAYPTEVTGQMVANFEAGGAAINQLARAVGAELRVSALRPGEATADFGRGAAMTESELAEALAAGEAVVDPTLDLLVPGEMGIGNTTAAAALCAALLGGNGAAWAGPGTGLDGEGVRRKAWLVDEALSLHASAVGDPLEALRRLGGREIAAIAGAILAAREVGVPILLDGFVAGAAAAVLHALNPTALDHCMAGHRSAEPGHRRLLETLGLVPLLDLGMRLGEGSGAAVAVSVVRAAVACHMGMATFAEAGVSDRT